MRLRRIVANRESRASPLVTCTAEVAEMDVRTNRQLAPPVAHPSSGSIPLLQPALQKHNQSVARLRFKLAGALDKADIPPTLQSSIFDLAQLWFCFGVERQLECEGGDMNLVYQKFDPHEANPLCAAGTLRVVRIAGVSHDQGWASSEYENQNTTTDSWTWVDMALTSGEQVIVEPVRAYTNWQANETFAYYEEDFDHDTQLLQSWTPGSKIETRLRSMFPGWSMTMRTGRVATFHAF